MTKEELKEIKKFLPGSDKINDVEVGKVIRNIMSCRDTLFDNSSVELRSGELVIDTKNEEVGYVVGKFCGYQYNQTERPGKKIAPTLGKPGEIDPVMLVVTLKKDQEVRDGIDFFGMAGTTESLLYRIRYTKRSLLKPLRIESDNFAGTSVTDLDDFCNQQCLMDCSEDCKLWKYKKKK